MGNLIIHNHYREQKKEKRELEVLQIIIKIIMKKAGC